MSKNYEFNSKLIEIYNNWDDIVDLLNDEAENNLILNQQDNRIYICKDGEYFKISDILASCYKFIRKHKIKIKEKDDFVERNLKKESH